MTRLDPTTLRYNRVVAEQLNTAWRVARRCGVHESQLDDVIQEVFLVVAAKLASVSEAAERPFVAAVTARVSANWRRSQLRRPEQPMDGLEELCCSEPAAYDGIERQQGLRLLQESLELMSESQREVFILAELEQFTAKEIAQQLDLHQSAVVSRLRRGREVFQHFCQRQRHVQDKVLHDALELG